MNNELQEMITNSSKPELAEQRGMVYQVWSDGEITLQKSGDLLWQRNLHVTQPSIAKLEDAYKWPNYRYDYGFIFCHEEDAEAIRELIRKEAILDINLK